MDVFGVFINVVNAGKNDLSSVVNDERSESTIE
jgi:hypothetical protein